MAATKSLVAVDLFAGCGGLSLGLERAGFRTLAYSELNDDAANTYAANRVAHAPLRFGDVKKLSTAKLKELQSFWKSQGHAEVDLVCGGPPCQGYSGIGHRRSYAVDREQIPSNHLYREMIRVVKQLRPRAFLFENVRGLMSGRWTPDGEKGEIWRDVLAAFSAIDGYEVLPTLVQAKDYGVPQNRPRVLIVGYRRDIGMNAVGTDAVKAGFLPSGSASPPDLVDVWSDLVDDAYTESLRTDRYPSAIASDFQREMRTLPDGTALRKGAQLLEQEYSNHSPRVKAKFIAMHKSGGDIPAEFQTKKFAQRLLTPHWGPQGPNITATSLADDFVHYSQPRSLTVREWARLQCFPDWYQFEGPRTTGGLRRAGKPVDGIWDREVPKYTQIGNAVPVRLAHRIGEHIADVLR